jgi:predicted DNA-binding protein YlxM (UPF0122 family)
LEALSISHHRDESLWKSLRDLLDSQPESQRQVLTLYYLGGMNSNEIAEFLGTSPTAIRHRIHRARLKLKKEMLAMMTGTFERKKLRASFTLRIVESVKHLKIQTMPRPIGPSWGISLIAGILLTVLSSGIQLNLIKTTDGKNILFCRNRDPGTWRLWDIFTIPTEGGAECFPITPSGLRKCAQDPSGRRMCRNFWANK